MKKINSIDYGGKIIGIGILFAVIVPVIIKLINILIKNTILDIIMWISLFIGVLIIVCFFIYLKIELHQDRKIDKYYSSHRNIKRPLDNGYYECSSCGNMKVREKDNRCDVCGVIFSDDKDKNVDEIV